MKNKILVGAGLSACALAWAAKDPVIMTVNGIDVPLSEFEYLYHKNSQQQLAPQPIEEYAEMFKTYKLKVADAKAAGIDTTEAFRKEMEQYRHELAKPYLTDSVFLNKLVAEAAERGKEEVETSHIMFFKKPSAELNKANRERLDSIRHAILDGADFGEMAVRFSEDGSAKMNKGNLGFLVANRYPYAFEMAAYATPENTVSEIVESPVGYHIIKTGKRRAARGKVLASHIMKMVRPGSPSSATVLAYAAIDSLYKVVKAHPEQFADVAKANSDDRGSAVKGGELPWFGPGEMVPEFENAAFALEEGEISEPVESQYGWHIIQKRGAKGPATAEEMKPELLRRFNMQQDGRDAVIRRHYADQLAAKHKALLNSETVAAIKACAADGIDSTFVVKLSEKPLADKTVITIGKKRIPVSEYALTVSSLSASDADAAAEAIDSSIDSFFLNCVEEAEEDWLYANNKDYRNLLNEYREGSLLYEISVAKVWDKASKDEAGLENYFNTHRNDYKWENPRVKGILVMTKGDSLANVIKARMNEMGADSVMLKVRKEFRGKASFDRILAEKGTNAMVDNIMFGGPEAKPTSPQYDTYFLFDARILNEPEALSDVKGQVTNDYQSLLESEWVKELQGKYPVKMDKKKLKKLK